MEICNVMVIMTRLPVCWCYCIGLQKGDFTTANNCPKISFCIFPSGLNDFLSFFFLFQVLFVRTEQEDGLELMFLCFIRFWTQIVKGLKLCLVKTHSSCQSADSVQSELPVVFMSKTIL